MADGNNSGKMGVLGVLIGALIVIAVGGGILYATGSLGPRPTTVTIQQPAATPAPVPPAETDRSRRDDRSDNWRNDRRDDRDDRRPERR